LHTLLLGFAYGGYMHKLWKLLSESVSGDECQLLQKSI